MAERMLLSVTAAQWFWMATRAWQSSARSLFAPVTLGFAVRSTKVPSVQPVAESAEIGSGAGVVGALTVMDITPLWVSPPEEV